MRVPRRSPLVGLLWSPWAMAQDAGCVPMDAAVIAAHVDAAYAAMYDDDAGSLVGGGIVDQQGGGAAGEVLRDVTGEGDGPVA